MSLINKFLRSPWAIIFGLLLLTGTTYGPLIMTMGLYWDDWPSLWFLHFFGPQVFPQAFAIDRPVQGWLFVPTTAIFGESLLGWQIFGILARWLSGLALGWLLWSVWPRRTPQILGVVILFLVYPGFSQQLIAITYGHQFLIMAACFLSQGIMIWSIRKSAGYWLLTGLSLAVGLLSMFALEYFFGLELLRPVWLWILTGEKIRDTRKRLLETGKRWLPYLVMDIGFLVWRLTHSTPRGEVTIFKDLSSDPAASLRVLTQEIVNDIAESALFAWGKALGYLKFSGIKTNVLAVYLGIAAAVFILAIALLLLARSNAARRYGALPKYRWGMTALLVGVFALFIGGWPVWVTDLRLELSLPWDRFTEALMLGACLALVGLIDLLIRPSWPKMILIGILAGLGAGAQLNYALNFRQEWVDQRNFFWQLAWRAPAIEPGTAMMTADLPFYSSTDNSLSAALNWIYAPELEAPRMPYMFFDLTARLEDNLPSLDPNVPLFESYRATEFSGNTSQSLVFYYNPPRCLKVLDLFTDRHYPNKPGQVVLALPLSKLELIQSGAEDEPRMPVFLGPEPRHNWCYYFEKVDLSVQLEQWEKAANFADQALKTKPELNADNAPELVPLIYAYAHAGKIDKAVELSLQAANLSKKMHYYLCDTWFYLAKDLQGDPEFDAAAAQINQRFECSAP